MSELPELSRVTKRVRPVPAGGAVAAVRAGRRRRNRVVGAAAGSVTAGALVVAFVLAAPGSHDETLQPAQNPVSGAVPAATSPAPALAPAAPVVAPSHLPAGEAPAVARGSADPHRPTATAAAPHARREAYTESPRDVAAPQTCRQGPTGSAGPVVYGGATACSVASSGPSSVKRGGRVSGSADICVPHGGQPTVIGFDRGQEHEVLVTNADGELVYRFSDTVRFVQGAHRRTIGDGRCLEWTGTWDTAYTNGKLVPSGRYQVTLSLRPDTIAGRRNGAGEGGSMSFSVDVQ